MNQPTRRTVNRGEAQLAYFAAARALNLTVDLEPLKDMAEQTADMADVGAAVDAMRETATALPPSHTIDGPTRVKLIMQAVMGVLVKRAVMGVLAKRAAARGNPGHA